MLFDTQHIIWIISVFVSVTLMMVAMSIVKKQKYKDIFLFTCSMICLAFHLSMMYVSFFKHRIDGTSGTGDAWDCMLLPIYFCNWVMDLQVAIAVWPNKKTKFFNNFATFTAYGGIFGALITLFIVHPGFSSYNHFQSALSHMFLLVTSVYLFVGGYVKIRVVNVIPYFIGLLSCGVVGLGVDLLYYVNGLPSPNPMYLHSGPSQAPMFTCWTISGLMLLIVFIFTVIWEACALKKKDQWFNKVAFVNELASYYPFIKSIPTGKVKEEKEVSEEIKQVEVIKDDDEVVIKKEKIKGPYLGFVMGFFLNFIGVIVTYIYGDKKAKDACMTTFTITSILLALTILLVCLY